MPSGENHVVFHEVKPLTAEDLVRCSFSSWYLRYKQHALTKTEIIKPLPNSFIEYLTSDGIKLPKDDTIRDVIDDNSDYSDWEDADNGDISAVEAKQEDELLSQFQDLHNEIKQKIGKLGNRFTPKLNWSAPKDSTWILPNNTMECHGVNDLYLLLNASNYVMHDLTETFGDDIPKPQDFQYELVLRKWYEDLNPALEFRCFVKNRTLIGISQRDLNYYTFLDELYDNILDSITAFFEKYLQTTFESDNFIFDVYLARPSHRVYLIDINPFTRVTDSLLFTWNELSLMNETEPEFSPELRLVDEVNTGRFASKEHSENQVPKDIVDATMDSNAMAELAREWRRMMEKEESEEEESE